MKNSMILLRSLFVAYALLLTTSLADAKKNKNNDEDTQKDSAKNEADETPDHMEGHSLEDSFYLKPDVTLHTRFVDNYSVESYDKSVTCLFAKAVRLNMYSPEEFKLSPDGSFVTDQEGNNFNLNIWQGNCEDGVHTVDFTKNDDGKIIYINVAKPHGDNTHYQDVEGETDVFYVYKDSMMLDEDDSNTQHFDEITSKREPTFLEVDDGGDLDHEDSYSSGETDGNRRLPKSEQSNRASLRGSNKDRHLVDICNTDNSNRCTCFKVVKVAILYDAAFCSKYKGNVDANIQDIVRQASRMYEEDMCVKIQINYIWNVDEDGGKCTDWTNKDWDKNTDGRNDLFNDMPRSSLCSQSGNWIGAFTQYMNRSGKNNFNVPAHGGTSGTGATHLFSGYPASGPVGCAWVGKACSNSYAYGIDLMDWTRSRRAQAAVFAHELGHNLGCNHVPIPNAVMYGAVGAETSGFSDICKELIYETLSSKTCFTTEPNQVFQAPPAPVPQAPPMEQAPYAIPQWLTDRKKNARISNRANDKTMAWNNP